ncbi:hypothetical protein GWI33_010047 [Rhynchophorus ferrugineus]|uniref:Capsular polysaccharide biosynthesis protein n=1 Tax=Rhynchophorus ferrugineus TaxID=354439 RepID=A0A834M9C5_RHYFE|nr:hypothetical protein GWI33_010047 [Rhynchophorus ferrugineus]
MLQDEKNAAIDIVIAWVDGNDPQLKKKRLQYQDKKQASDSVSATRFASNNEIYYSIASILKHVPFCRNIYIVADNQKPAFIDAFVAQGICEQDKIRIVDHRKIFAGYEQYLPTFNSLSIESMLWNIQGLSDYFIYMNDDFFFNQPAQIEDFLVQDQIVLYGHWVSNLPLKLKLMYRKLLQQWFDKPIQPRHTISQMLGADILGFQRYFEIHHFPHIVDRKILQGYLLSHSDLLEQQIRYKFRSIAQLNPISLMNHLKIKAQQAILKADIPVAYLKNAKSKDEFLARIQNQQIKYGCIQSLDQLDNKLSKEIQDQMVDKFKDYLPTQVIRS